MNSDRGFSGRRPSTYLIRYEVKEGRPRIMGRHIDAQDRHEMKKIVLHELKQKDNPDIEKVIVFHCSEWGRETKINYKEGTLDVLSGIWGFIS